MATWEQYAKDYEKAEPFQKICIPYSFARDNSGAIYLSDVTMGMAWFLEPLHTSHLTGKEKDSIANRLAAALALLEDNTRVQFLVLPTRNIRDSLNAYRKNSTTKNPFLSELGKVKERFFANGVKGLGAMIGDLEFCIKNCRIMVTVAVQGSRTVGTNNQAVKDALSKTDDEEEDEGDDDKGYESGLAGVRTLRRSGRTLRKSLNKAVGTLESTFSGLGLRFQRANQAEFVQFYQSMVHIESGPKAIINPQDDRPLADQVVRKEIKLLPDGYILSDGYYHSVLTIDAYPSETYTGLLSEPHANLGNLSLLDFVIDGVVCINIFVPKREAVTKWNDDEYKLANEGEGDPVERKEKIEDCKLIRYWTRTQGKRMLDVQISISMADKEKYLVRGRIEHVQSKLQEMGFMARIEESAAPTFWAHQLPFGWKPSMPGAKRVKRRVDLVVADLLPIYLMGRGTNNPAFMAINQRGEPFALDFFDSNTGYNFGIVAETGGGKSVLLNAITADYLRNNKVKVFIIDKGYSYRPLMNQIGIEDAEFIELDPQGNPSINPFEGTYESSSAFLLEWIPFLATAKDERLDGNLLGRMEMTLRRTYERKLRKAIPYVTIDDIDTKYPDLYIAKMAKRVKIRYLDQEKLASLMEMRSAGGGKNIIFEIYHEIRITGRNHADHRRVNITTLNDIQGEEYRVLCDGFPYVQDDEHGMFVLTSQESSASSLAFEGWECELLKTHLVLEVADSQDYQSLAAAGVRAILPDEYLEQRRQDIRSAIVESYGNSASEEQIGKAVEAKISEIDGVSYVSDMTGYADLQEVVFFREFAQELRESKDPKQVDLAERLSPYYGTGAYSKYFDKPTVFKLSQKKIFCWECERLFNGDKKLVGAVLGALFHMITSYCMSPRSRNFQKIVFIDEYKKFQDSPITDTFVDETQRQGRKHGFCVGVGTQSINDLAYATKNILQGMQFMLIGPQFPSVVDEMGKTLKFNAVQRAKVASLKNEKGMWSEFVLNIPRTKYCETMRVMLDPLLYWLFTTDRQDKPERENAAMKFALEGKGPREALFMALKECATKWPRGVYHAQKVKM